MDYLSHGTHIFYNSPSKHLHHFCLLCFCDLFALLFYFLSLVSEVSRVGRRRWLVPRIQRFFRGWCSSFVLITIKGPLQPFACRCLSQTRNNASSRFHQSVWFCSLTCIQLHSKLNANFSVLTMWGSEVTAGWPAEALKLLLTPEIRSGQTSLILWGKWVDTTAKKPHTEQCIRIY